MKEKGTVFDGLVEIAFIEFIIPLDGFVLTLRCYGAYHVLELGRHGN